MPRSNVEIVRELYELFPDLAAGPPPPAVLDLFDPAACIDHSRNVFNPATHEGHDGLLESLATLRETWDSFALEPERFVEQGDLVAVVNKVRARGASGGVEVNDRSTTVHTLRDGRIVRLAIYPDVEEGLRALGA